ncbi:hypothetical protein WR25_19328 [Diploscapter pachys]|uniref:Uncharacterized protein n=1 Tax=Diploscapter pachys TaxID=2018661 RepID=A0A2A2JUI6_9BILA|nr:hypothetical protein WR25_19328 [Diploscapter pachys]
MVLVRNALLKLCLVRNALLGIIFGAQRLTWKNCGAQSPRRAEALRTKNFGAQRLTLALYTNLWIIPEISAPESWRYRNKPGYNYVREV